MIIVIISSCNNLQTPAQVKSWIAQEKVDSCTKVVGPKVIYLDYYFTNAKVSISKKAAIPWQTPEEIKILGTDINGEPLFISSGFRSPWTEEEMLEIITLLETKPCKCK